MRRARRNRIGRHGGEIERLALQAGYSLALPVGLGAGAPVERWTVLVNACGGSPKKCANPVAGACLAAPDGNTVISAGAATSSLTLDDGKLSATFTGTRREPYNSTPHGGQTGFVWLSARTPHGAYVW